MSQIIVHVKEDGSVSVTVPTQEALDSHGIEWIKNKDTPDHSIIMDSSELPESDKDFFDAWELTDGKITVSLDKAKEITKKQLRLEREPLLQAQDVAFQRALEAGADTSVIVVEKQRLRDLPLLTDAAISLDELRLLKA